MYLLPSWTEDYEVPVRAIREGEEDEEIMNSWICSWGFSERTRVSAMRWVTWAGGLLSRFRMVLGSGRNSVGMLTCFVMSWSIKQSLLDQEPQGSDSSVTFCFLYPRDLLVNIIRLLLKQLMLHWHVEQQTFFPHILNLLALPIYQQMVAHYKYVWSLVQNI